MEELFIELESKYWDYSEKYGADPKMIVIHPDTFKALEEYVKEYHKVNWPKDAVLNYYRGVPIYRSEDVKPGKIYI